MTGSKVLVVEDERIVALHLRQQLGRLGYEVVAVAFSGEQALRQAGEHRPHVVLMDIHLEGSVDGIDTAREIGRQFHIPVIFLSAHSEEPTIERARATGPFGYILKPFSERELHVTIQMCLERRAAEQELMRREEHLRLALDAADMGSWELDPESRQIRPGGRARRIFGFPGEAFSRSWHDFLSQIRPEDRLSVVRMFDRVIGKGELCQAEFRNRKRGGRRWLRVQGRIFELDGVKRVVGVVRDVTDERAAEARLRQAATVFEALQDGVVIFDRSFRILSVNQGFLAMCGYREEDLLGRKLTLLARTPETPDTRLRAIEQTLRHSGVWQGEVAAVRQTGESFPLELKVVSVAGAGGRVTHYVAVCTDVSAIRKAEAELKFLAHYDPLTGLPNRLLAQDRLEHAIDRCERGHHRVGLLFVDIDHFKTINDTLGHATGDELLKGVAQRMRRAVRAEDTVARLGGDEFMVIIERVERVEDVADIARKIIAQVAQPVVLSAGELTVSASVGISLFPDDGTNCDGLIRAADTAMYVAKDQGRGRYTFYTSEMTANAVDYMTVKQDLRRGLEQGELRLFFQPQFALASGAMTGVEALVRWQHPRMGLQGADRIIPVAERSGLILDIGEWVIRSACRQLREWRSQGLPLPKVAVNVSPLQMRCNALIDVIAAALADWEIPPDLLEVEVTETVLQDDRKNAPALHAIRDMGVSLAIDDFGTGYSCLKSLKALPIQRVKIDRGFIQDAPDQGNNGDIAGAIIAMAHRLGFGVVAEGVETSRQEEFLRHLGCEDVQGFLYGPPMSARALAALLREPEKPGALGERARRAAANRA
ncbi:MAG: EAL domain-containing protein [Telmatospirillum sp.]|nr:EAL domain-containing protein [Telmatospirillum sp.]